MSKTDKRTDRHSNLQSRVRQTENDLRRTENDLHVYVAVYDNKAVHGLATAVSKKNKKNQTQKKNKTTKTNKQKQNTNVNKIKAGWRIHGTTVTDGWAGAVMQIRPMDVRGGTSGTSADVPVCWTYTPVGL